MIYYLYFGFFCLIFTAVLCSTINDNVKEGNPYIIWLMTVNITLLVIYGMDKLLAKTKAHGRVPENILHFLALLGGFLGGWTGRFIFHHKTNARDHPAFVPILALGTFIHGALIYYLFLRHN